MKQRTKIIASLIIWVILAVALVNNIRYAADEGVSLAILVDGTSYSAGDDIEVSVKLNKKTPATTFYIQYDSSKVQYKSKKPVSKGQLTVKNFPEDNTLRVAYTDSDDESEMGTDKISVVFTALEDINSIPNFSLSNTTITIEGVDDPYKQSNGDIEGIDAAPVLDPDINPAPSTVPSTEPSTVPSTVPSTAPSTVPSTAPSTVPSTAPSTAPSTVPSTAPSSSSTDIDISDNNNQSNTGNEAGTTTDQNTTNQTDKEKEQETKVTEEKTGVKQDNTQAKSKLPQTGSNVSTYILAGALVIVTMYLLYCIVKFRF